MSKKSEGEKIADQPLVLEPVDEELRRAASRLARSGCIESASDARTLGWVMTQSNGMISPAQASWVKSLLARGGSKFVNEE